MTLENLPTVFQCVKHNYRMWHFGDSIYCPKCVHEAHYGADFVKAHESMYREREELVLKAIAKQEITK